MAASEAGVKLGAAGAAGAAGGGGGGGGGVHCGAAWVGASCPHDDAVGDCTVGGAASVGWSADGAG